MNSNFNKWVRNYEGLYAIELNKWQKKNNCPGIIPLNFDTELISHYTAYKNEQQTKNLVIATWGLAIVTIILSVLTLFVTK